VDPGASSGTERASRRWLGGLHWPSVVVLVVGVAVTTTVTVGSISSINGGDARLLRAQARQVDSALQAAVPALYQPLVAANRIASTVSVEAFRTFAKADVADGGPFSSVSLWRRTNGHLVLVTIVGARPSILSSPSRAAAVLGQVRPSTQLTVTGLVSRRPRGLGLAEMLPGSRSGLIVYAENVLPTTTVGTPFQGLNFAVYFGRSTRPSQRMVSSIPLPPRGPTMSTVVPFGSAEVTIVSALLGRAPGVLPPEVPYGVGLGGALLTILATYLVERLVRRREAAERSATDHARESDAQRGIAETLQHSLLPSEEPRFPGVEMAGRYVSGTARLDVGGDWYDAIPLDGERLFLTVGDVSGRGLRAATVMGSLRHAIRAYAVQGDDPAQVLRKLDDLVDVGRDGCFATVLCIVIDVPRRRVRVASAGHLPALLVDAAGARFVDTPANTPVGVASAAAVRSTTVTVAPDTAVLLYTDGLVERRDQTIDEGLERLRVRAADVSGAIGDVLDGVLAVLAPGGADDDLAMLGLRFAPARDEAVPPLTEAPAGPGLAWQAIGHGATAVSRHFANAPASAASARAFAVSELPAGDVGDHDVVALLVSELATNAVLHASSPFEVTVVTHAASGRVRIGVRDEGDGTPVRQGPRPMAPHGRGLRIVEELSARWGVEWDGDGGAKTVWFEVRHEPRPDEGAHVPSSAAEA
jgi:serine phosphatase RsbU (regulator of sigma subunit)/anti-sigma regulatory factor (Ser/Thr protein kinase)